MLLIISHSEKDLDGANERANPEHLHGPGFREDVGVDVHHQVASRCVLHDEADVLRRLEARKQVDQEGMPHAVDRLEDPLLAHQAGEERTPLHE